MIRLSILLRLAVLVNRSRLRASPPRLKIKVTDKTISMGISRKWLEKNPLTRTDLDSEQDYFRSIHYTLKYRVS